MFKGLLLIHLISDMTWFAGLLLLPWMFTFHAYALRQADFNGARHFEIMERQLYRWLIHPAMWASITLGLLLAISHAQYFFTAIWFYGKILVVILLIGYQHYVKLLMRKLCQNKTRAPIFYRFLMIIPFLLSFLSVALTLFKPQF